MDPELWDTFAQKFGADEAERRFGARPEGMSERQSELLGAANRRSVDDQEPATRLGRARVGMVDGTARAFLQGASLGTSDEIIAGVRAIGDGTYKDAVADERGRLESFRSQHPVASTVTELAGGVASGVAGGLGAARVAPKLAGAVSRLRGAKKLAALSATGAAGGGAAAAATAEEGGRIESVPRGAAWGAMLAPVGIAAGKALSTTARALPGTNRLIASADDQALDLITKNLERDQALPEGSSRLLRARAARTADAPVSIMELGEDRMAPLENVRDLGQAAANVPGESKKVIRGAVEGRMEGQGQRLSRGAREKMGLGAGDAIEAADEIAARRQTDALQNYGAAYDQEVPLELVGDVLADEPFRDAYESGVRIAKAEGNDLPALDALADAGGVPVRAIDYMKQGMDDVIDRRMRSGALGPREARAWRGRLRAMLDRVDEKVPEYGQARQVYSGQSAMLDALEFGKKEAPKMDARLLARQVADLPAGEQEMVRLGMLDDLTVRMDKMGDTHDKAGRIFGNPEMRARFEAVFPSPEAWAEFADQIRGEQAISSTRRTINTGSRTTPMAAVIADTGAEIAENAVTAAQSAKVGLIRTLMGAVTKRMRGETERALSATAPRLTATGDELVALLDEIDDFVQRRAAAQAGSSAAVAGGATVPAGRLAQARQGGG